MSPSTATAAARRSPHGSEVARRRARARRRRRLVVALVTLAALGVGLVLAMPLAKKAINEFGLPLRYQDIIRQQAAEKHLDPALVAAVIYAETKFDPRTSSAGAMGPMQIEPQTAAFLARRSGAQSFTTSDLDAPQVNIAYGTYYLRYLLDEYHGNIVLALAAYNAGETNVDRWLAGARAAGSNFRIDDIPFPETRDYVSRVLGARADYRRTYASQLGYG